MAKAVGRVTLPGWRQDGLRALLMWHYEDNFEFWKEWLSLLYRYERLLEALARAKHRDPHVGTRLHDDLAWEALDAAIKSSRVPTKVGGERQSRNIHLRRYREDLKALCDKWGLRCYWALAWIHASFVEWVTRIVPAEQIAEEFDKVPPAAQAFVLRIAFEHGLSSARQIRNRWRRYVQDADRDLPDVPQLLPPRFIIDDVISDWQRDERQDHLYRRHIRTHGSPTSNNMIRVEVEYQPWPVDDWQDVRKQILKEARRRRDEIRRAWVKAGWSLRDREPELGSHIHWLYLRICPQKDIGRPWGWQKIADARGFSKTTVRDAVLALAHELGIILPELPSGPAPEFA